MKFLHFKHPNISIFLFGEELKKEKKYLFNLQSFKSYIIFVFFFY